MPSWSIIIKFMMSDEEPCINEYEWGHKLNKEYIPVDTELLAVIIACWNWFWIICKSMRTLNWRSWMICLNIICWLVKMCIICVILCVSCQPCDENSTKTARKLNNCKDNESWNMISNFINFEEKCSQTNGWVEMCASWFPTYPKSYQIHNSPTSSHIHTKGNNCSPKEFICIKPQFVFIFIWILYLIL